MGDNHPSQAENRGYRGRKRRMRRSNDRANGPEGDSKARISERMNNPKGGY